MLRLIFAGLLALAIAPATLAQVLVYRDTQQHIYFEGLPANQPMRVQYNGSSRLARRYQQAWMYRDTRQSCQLHLLWRSKKFVVANGVSITVQATPLGDLAFPVNTIAYAASGSVPCAGAVPNPSLPWVDLGAGIRAVRLFDACRYQYLPYRDSTPEEARCQGAEVLFLAGLPGAAYRVNTTLYQERFAKSDPCGFLKLANTAKWPAAPKDQFTLTTHFNPASPDYQNFGNFNRGTMAYREFRQIPKCFDGVRFLPSLP